MKKKKRGQPVPTNPKKILMILLLGVFAAVAVIGGWLVLNHHNTLNALQFQFLPMSDATDKIEELDDLLVLYSETAVLTGAEEWKTGYDKFRQQFGEAIERCRKIPADNYLIQTALDEVGDRKITATEDQAMRLALLGKRSEAVDLLSSPAYQEQRAQYNRAVGHLGTLVKLEIEKSVESIHFITLQGVAVLIFVLVLLVLLWSRTVWAFNRYEFERDQVEAALRESEERFRDLIENIPVGVYRITPGPDGKFIAVNPAMAKMFGYDSPEEFIRSDVRQLYADDEERREFTRRLRAEGRVFGAQLRLRRRDGSLIWGAISANVIRNAKGRILYVDGIEEDITERKKTEELIRANEERYRLLAENARDVIWTADLAFNWLYISPAVERLRGFTPKEAMAQSLDQTFTPASRELLSETLAEELNNETLPGADTHRTRTLELEVTCKDGSTVWTEMNMSFVRDESGRVIGIQGSARDIRERRRTEEILRKSEALHRGIIETADEGIWIIDQKNMTVFVNSKMADMLGYTPEEMRGRTHYEFLDESSLFQAERNERLRREGIKTHADLRFRRKDGAIFWTMVAATPMFESPGQYGGTLLMITDINDRKRAEEALRKSEERYRLLAENARDVILTADMNLGIQYISPAIELLTGFNSDEAVQLGIDGLLASESLKLAHRTLAEEIMIESQPDRPPNRVRTMELEINCKDGGSVWTEIKVSFLRDASGHALGIQGSMRDITERRRVELALRNSEELYRGIIETADEGVWITEAGGRTTFVNAKLAQMLGYAVEEMIGRSDIEFMDPEGRAIAKTNDQLRRKGLKTHNDFKFLRKDGSDFWAIVSASPNFDDDGKYAGTLAMITDITERKRAEEGSRILAAVSSLFLAGKDINMAINTVLEMCGEFDGADRAYVYLLSEDQQRISNTHEWCTDGIRGYIQEMQSLPAADFAWLTDQHRRGQSVIVPNIESTPANLREHLKRREVKSLVTFTIFILGKFEGFCGFDAVARVRNWTPADVSVLRQTAELIARGVERRRAEEALRNSEALYTSLVEHLNQVVFRKDREGRFTFVNSRLSSLTRRAPDQLLGRTDYETKNPEIGRRFREEDERVLRTGETVESGLEFTRPDGGTVYYHIVKTPVRDANREIIGLQGIAWDITGQKKAEETLRAASRMEATSTLAGGIAHDFNNLMVGILGNAELLELSLGDRPDLTKRLKTIAASARRGGDLAHQLLAFARGGKTQPIPMNLRETVEEALQLQHRVVPPDVEIELNIAPDLWSIHADPAQMTQVAMNLVINAIEAITGPGKITISAENMALENEFVQLRPALKPGPHVRLTVEDTGCGMSEEVRSRAFEPFFTTKFQGRGLGLAAIYGIVQSHSGHIEVESEPGRGSTFRVYLPALPSTPVPSASLTQAAPAPRGTETLLVVDDDETVLEVSQLMLQKLGYQVLTARSGIEAVEMLRARQSRTDLAIIDLNMPGMNGRETCRVLKKEYPELKVLFCTGDPDDSFAGGLEADRADGYILKPIRMDALAQEIRNTLEGAARA